MGLIKNIKNALKSFSGNTLTASNGLEFRVDQNGRPQELLFYPFGFDGYSYSERNFDEFVQSGYTNPYVFMVVDRIATLLKNIPVILCDEDDEIIVDERWDSLYKKTNSRYNWEKYIYAFASSYLVNGNAITWGTAPLGFNEYEELEIALPQNVTIYTNTGTDYGIPEWYYVSNQYGYGRYSPDRLLHLRKPNIINDSNWGLSNLYAGQPVYTASNKNFHARVSMFGNRGANGVLSPKGEGDVLSESEQGQLQRSFQHRHAGTKNMGQTVVSTTPMMFTGIGMNANDLKLVESNIQDLRNACALYSMPSVLFSDSDNAKFNNWQEAKAMAYTDAVLPLGEDIYEEFSNWLIQGNLGINGRLKMDTSKIEALQKDKGKEHERVRKDVETGILTPQQANEILYPEMGYQQQNNNLDG